MTGKTRNPSNATSGESREDTREAPDLFYFHLPRMYDITSRFKVCFKLGSRNDDPGKSRIGWILFLRHFCPCPLIYQCQ
ncbi:hypothetical protein X777_16021 [Ooceraea biroi]|uniref:Uncharacterized protein n=1 Tax=Ooceraea biroi TaxID=2015173 RepID=A0A026WTI6_OOCBI|nr:hypothetical protein X777_16021 [Ooceraea biroi]